MGFIHNSKKPLLSCLFPFLERQIGVSVSKEYTHTGFSPPGQMVDIEREYPEFITATADKITVPLAEWEKEAAGNLCLVLSRIDALISELKEHRVRLSIELPALLPPVAPDGYSEAFIFGFKIVAAAPPRRPINPFPRNTQQYTDWRAGASEAGIDGMYTDGVLNLPKKS